MLSKFSVKKPFTVLVGVVLVLVLGFVSVTRMTTDLLPDMSFPYVVVITTDVGSSPEEIEDEVTAPIEAAMATTSNINDITSISYNSYSIVILEYEQDSNMDSIMIEIQQELDLADISDTAGTPILMQIDPDMMPIMIAAVDMEDATENELSQYVDSELTSTLESTEGVASVSAIGLVEEEIIVTLNQDKIDELNEKIIASIEGEFDDAQDELDEAEEEIESGQSTIDSTSDQLSDAMDTATAQRDELYETEADLEEQLEELESQKESLESLQSTLNDFIASDEYAQLESLSETISTLESELASAQETVTALEAQIAAADETTAAALSEQLATAQAAVTALETQLTTVQASLDAANTEIASQFAALSSLGITVDSYDDLPDAAASISETLTTVNTGIASIEEALEQIEAGERTVADAIDSLNNSTALASIQIGSSSAQLAVAESSISDAQDELDSAKDTALESADLDSIITIDTVTSLLTAQNFSMPAGYATDDDDTEYLVSVGDTVDSAEDLENLALMTIDVDGVGTITLSDVADIEVIDNAEDSYAVLNGNPGLLLSIEKQTGYSTGTVTDTLNEKFEELEAETDGLDIAVLMDQGVYIDLIQQSVLMNMIYGAIFAIIVLFLFLRDIRPTLVIACSIPLSVILAVVLMYFTDISFNVISLSGLCLGIGMLVDNSIVVIENIYRLRAKGYSVRKAAVEGAGQVSGAIIASTLTTVSVYLPIIFTEGITRQLFVDLGLTVAFTLLASLIIALTVVPATSSALLTKTKDVKHTWFDKFNELYAKALRVCLRFKPLVFIGCLALLAISGVLVMSRGMTFMDMDMETDQATVTVSANEGDTLTEDELIEYSDEIIDRMLEIEGIEAIGAMSGSGTTLSSLSADSAASIYMYVLFDEDRSRSSDEILDEVLEKTADLDCLVEADSSASDFTAYFSSGLSVQIEGSDLQTLQELAAEVAEVLENTEGTVDVDDGLDNTTPEFVITVDKEKAAEYNYTVAQIYQIVYAEMADSSSVTTISNDINNYEVYLQTEEQADVTLNDIKALTFTYTNDDGDDEEIPLEEVCEFEETTTLSSIFRSSQTRYLTVSAGIDDDHNVTLVSSEVQDALDKLDIPEGYSLEMTGEDSTIYDAMDNLMMMLVLAVIFIYLIMVAQFQSLLSPFIVMFTIPLGFTGAFLALYITGYELSVISVLGLIMLAGVIVNNGIVLVDYINQMRREGMSKKDAIVDAGKSRMRPVLMTALTTIFAMLAMALGLGGGTDLMTPMAIAVIGGLVYGTLLTLFVVPCIYDALNREKNMVEEEL